MTEVDDLSVVSKEAFSGALTRFLGITNSSSSLAFLIGAGCSRCAGLPLTNELTDKVLEDDKLDALSKEILIAVRGKFAGGVGVNIEDYLSEIVDMLAITERRAEWESKIIPLSLLVLLTNSWFGRPEAEIRRASDWQGETK